MKSSIDTRGQCIAEYNKPYQNLVRASTTLTYHNTRIGPFELGATTLAENLSRRTKSTA
jgi:hypothetical protein